MRPNPTYLAVSKMAVEADDFQAMALEALAAQYPELDFLFHKLAAQAEVISEQASSDLQNSWDLEDELQELKDVMTSSKERIDEVLDILEDNVPAANTELEIVKVWLTTN